jgi:hypothetical protein
MFLSILSAFTHDLYWSFSFHGMIVLANLLFEVRFYMFNYTIAALIIIAMITYLLSFLKPSKTEVLEKQVEHLSLSMMQETYQIKKQLKVLQEELMVDNLHSLQQINEPAKPVILDKTLPASQQVIQLHKRGYRLEEIAKHTSLPIEEVRLTLQKQHWGGGL